MNRIRKLMTACTLVALCGSATTVVAQDSVGITAGAYNAIEGDAPTSHEIDTQCFDYVLDLARLESSWGNVWGVGPLAKTSDFLDPLFFNTLMSNQSFAQTVRLGADRSGTMYADWNLSDPANNIAPGVNPDDNTGAPFLLMGPTNSAQMAYVFSEFGGADPNSENSNIIAGLVNWDPVANPGRLYVQRRQAAVANEFLNTPASASFGVGMIDSDGNAFFRADTFGTTGPNPILDQAAYRVRVDDRTCSQINWINLDDMAANYDGAATDDVLLGELDVVVVPNILPEQLAASGSGRLVTTTFGNEYVFENPPNVPNLLIGAHLNTVTEQRGSVALSRHAFFANSVATGAVLSKPLHNAAYGGTTIANLNDDTLGISVFGIGSDGSLVATAPPVCLPWVLNTGPGSITDGAPSGIDPNTGSNFTVTSAPLNAATPAEFSHTTGSTSFRGPTAQCDVGRDSLGNALVSGVVFNQPLGGSFLNPGNTLVVARFDPTDPAGTTEWTAAAWNNFNGNANNTEGKVILDAPSTAGGVPVARLVPYEIASLNDLRGLGGGPGPSITPAGFDEAGNIYFVSTIQIKRGAAFDNLDGGAAPPNPLLPDNSPNPERDRFEFGLVRGVLTSTATEFYYELELVMATGDVYLSRDTGLEYQVQNINITTSGGGTAPNGFDSGDVSNGPNPNGIPQSNADPLTLTGLVIEVEITYDVDGADTVDPNNPNPNAGGDPAQNCPGGFFDFPVEVGGSGPFENPADDDACANPLFPNSTDQSYRVLLFIGSQPSAVGACCVGPQCVENVSADQCATLNGDYQGDDTLCADVQCEILGACCFGCDAQGNFVICQELTRDDCCAANGVYAGDNTSCANQPCDQLCRADLDGDGDVDVFDFGLFGPNFGSVGVGRCQGDFDCDGDVDVFDFGVFGPNFGCTSTPVPNQCCTGP